MTVDSLLDRFPDIRECVTPAQLEAMHTLEDRGLCVCAHFGYENAEDLLAGMDRACDMGCLYEWLNRRMGIVTK